MVWPLKRQRRKRIARISLEGPIAGSSRRRVLKALRQVEERKFPALLLRIDSPGGTVGDSQEIHHGPTRKRGRLRSRIRDGSMLFSLGRRSTIAESH